MAPRKIVKDGRERVMATARQALDDINFLTAKRGGRPPSGKKQITLRLGADVIEAFRATGKGWQGRIDDILRKAKP